MLLIPLQLCSLQRFRITLSIRIAELQGGPWFCRKIDLKHVLRSLHYFLYIIQRKIHSIKRKRKQRSKNKVNREREKETEMKKQITGRNKSKEYFLQ